MTPLEPLEPLSPVRDELLARLEAFSFDAPGTVRTFAARLAAEQGWPMAFTRRVVREYLRFVWLAVRAGHEVTPSPAVDAAWHLHLCCTRSYWHELCERSLGRPLHHEPSRGGAAETARFAAAYARTLASYRAFFGEEPPADVWPAPESDSRPPVGRRPVSILAGAIGAVLIVAAGGCVAVAAAGSIDATIVVAVVVAAVVLALWSRSRAAHGAQTKRRRASGGVQASGLTRNATANGGAACGAAFVPIPFPLGEHAASPRDDERDTERGARGDGEPDDGGKGGGGDDGGGGGDGGGGESSGGDGGGSSCGGGGCGGGGGD